MTEKSDHQAAEIPHESAVADEPALRRGYEQLRCFYELTARNPGDGDIDVVLAQLVESVGAVAGATRCMVLLMDSEDQLHPRIASSAVSEDDPIAASMSVMEEAMRNKQPIVTTRDDDGLARYPAIAALPMTHSDRCLGLVWLEAEQLEPSPTELGICCAMLAHVGLLIANAMLARRLEKETKTRKDLFKHIWPSLMVRAVTEGVDSPPDPSEDDIQDITILRLGIHGFPAVADGRSVSEMAAVTSEFFEIMSDALLVREGTLERFAGDELVALFGAPETLADAPLQAVRCASEMLDLLGEFNAVLAGKRLPTITAAIVVSAGEGFVGYVGSDKALRYMAIGDVMTRTSRMIAMAQSGDLLLSGPTYDRVAEEVEAAPVTGDVKPGRDAPGTWWQRAKSRISQGNGSNETTQDDRVYRFKRWK